MLGKARRRGDAGDIVERAAMLIQRIVDASEAPSTSGQGVVVTGIKPRIGSTRRKLTEIARLGGAAFQLNDVPYSSLQVQ